VARERPCGDLEQGGKVIAVYVNGQKIEREPEAVGCIGTLQQDWFEEESSFFHRSVLQDSRVERVTVLNGRVC